MEASKAPFPSYTKIWHDKPYPAVDPSRPELSAKGKVVVITGGAGSIGASMGRAFAIADAGVVVLLGRTEKTLAAAKASILAVVPKANIEYRTADIMNDTTFAHTVVDIARTHGKINVFVNNAGYLAKPASVADSDPTKWWRAFEVNILGSFNAVRAFLPVAAPDAYLINTSTGVAVMPPWPAMSGYAASKLAASKLFENLQVEHPEVHVLNIHPGVVESELNIKSGMSGMDHVDLPGDFTVWAASPEATAFKGKFLWINWDVDELKARAKEISSTNALTLGMDGWTASGWAGGASF